MPRGQPWPDEVRRRVLERLAAGETLGAASRAEGVPKVTAQGWAAAAGVEQPKGKTTEQTANARAERARRLEQAQDRGQAGLTVVRELALAATIGKLRGLQDAQGRFDDAKLAEVTMRDLVGAWTRAGHDLALLTGQATANAEVRVVFNVPLPDETPPPVVDEDDLPRLGP